jgi:hypothetical protein
MPFGERVIDARQVILDATWYGVEALSRSFGQRLASYDSAAPVFRQVLSTGESALLSQTGGFGGSPSVS